MAGHGRGRPRRAGHLRLHGGRPLSSAFSALTGWTLFTSLTLVIGAVASRWLLLPRCVDVSDEVREQARARVAGAGTAAAALLLIALALYFVRQLSEFRDPFAPWAEDARLLLGGTAWGRSWTSAVAASGVLLTGLFLARRGVEAGWWIATPAALLVAALPGLTGHAAGVEHLRAVALVADTVHVWAAGAWIGTLAVVLYLSSRRSPEGGGLGLDVLVPAFSPIAMGGVTLLALSGVYSGWTHLPGWGALASTVYGRTLALKVGLVVFVLGFGAVNWRVVTPRLGSAMGDRLLTRTAALELLIAQVVLVVTAILVRTSPTGH